MPARMPRGVQRAENNPRFAVECEHLVIFNQTIDPELTFQRFSGRSMSGHRNAFSVLAFQMSIKSFSSRDMIGVHVGEHDLANTLSTCDQCVNTFSEHLLFILVG